MSLKREHASILDPLFLAILAVAAFLLFFRLDHRPFWQDEAETACLARNVLIYGVPRAFDGVNLISQEENREFEADYLWRWTPWLQIYLSAAAFKLGGLNTYAGRFPYAVLGLLSVALIYLLVRRRYGEPAWARLAALLLALSVPFVLFARQGRYYSLGAFLAVLSVYAFRGDWQSRRGPAVLLAASLGLLFYANYLLFLTYAPAFLIAAVLVYRRELPLGRTLLLALFTLALILPGLALFRLQQQSALMDLLRVGENLQNYLRDLWQFMLPLPIMLYLLWRWRRLLLGRGEAPADPGEKLVLFLALVILGNLIFLTPVPSREYRYLVHLYPLAAILLGWVVWQAWRYHRFSGVLLALVLALTNWLHLVPLDWLGLSNRPHQTDYQMLPSINLPLKLYITELRWGYPDVNQSLVRFFQAQARPGETILTTYGDLPLQFYTSCRVVGGLSGRVPKPGELPDWVVKRRNTHSTRKRTLTPSEDFIAKHLRLDEDYQALELPEADENYGNRADPYYHRFVPPAPPFPRLIIHQRKTGVKHEGSP